MAEFVKLNPSELKALREVNPLLMSYNGLPRRCAPRNDSGGHTLVQ